MLTKNIENEKELNISYIFKKSLDLSVMYKKCGHEYKKIFKEKGIN